ncbi:class I SAM-dependent methyltransferase [Nakamurella sp. PAMC28650]|uniref:class I SAM-dependent methyltransferase n=1 Tax=Nakamurella sp. PAMC28650 TaxID=2762325 RepID=UPI00164D7524|nr:class I SAM-dependent methyltransferase [Nakamurella sp. PAMC28650]QNK82486.1 class I SAM-dependent methyltransferase [Nakamurella sp. PAMC28650]
MDEKQRENAASFGRAAEAYERGRPSYPEQALDWLLPENALHVVDLGAGTGKLTRLLSSRGLDVTAVDPSEGMREKLAGALPQVPVFAGTGEHLPLPDDSCDCVLAAQAWHWVDPDIALPEVARVLRPGGRLGLLWNLRDERVDWVAELGRVLRPAGGTSDSMSVEDLGPHFGPVESCELAWVHHTTAPQLMDMVASRSYVITASASQRATLLAQVAALVSTHPALAGAETIELPYVTQCFRADLVLT